MSAQEIELAIRTGISHPSLVPWLGYLIIAVLAFAGSFFGSYLKKRGEYRASREEFTTLLEQAKQTTQHTESIRQELASHNWLNQQQWQLREKYYGEILEALFKLKITLEERIACYHDPTLEQHGDHIRSEHFENQNHLGAEAFEKVRRLTGPAAIVMSQRAIAALEELCKAQSEASEQGAAFAAYLHAFLAAVNKANAVVLEEAKAALLGRPL